MNLEQTLFDRLDQNYADFNNHLLQHEKEEIIEMAGQIKAVRDTHYYLTKWVQKIVAALWLGSAENAGRAKAVQCLKTQAEQRKNLFHISTPKCNIFKIN